MNWLLKICKKSKFESKKALIQLLLFYYLFAGLFFYKGLSFYSIYKEYGSFKMWFFSPLTIDIFEGSRAVIIIFIIFIIGCAIIVYSIYLSICYFVLKEDDYWPAFLMCKQCLRPYARGDITSNSCQECGALLENLVGFYDRNPELKDKSENLPKKQNNPLTLIKECIKYMGLVLIIISAILMITMFLISVIIT
ncbi:MAG: hypothetical protein GY705_31250 [Bacteroidetes bacterium]|nr:hypothetical protein [Bacteroidota bacterium]